jgi:ATP-binding cassette, subfamily B, bacterial PglK
MPEGVPVVQRAAEDQTREAPVRTLRKALHLLGLEKQSRWVLLVTVALVASGFEILGAAMIFALLGLVSGEQADVELPLIGDVQSRLGLADDSFLLAAVALMAVFFVARGVVHIAKIYIQNRVVQNAAARLATRLVEGYLELPYAFHLQRNSSDIIRNAHQAVSELATRIYMPIITIAAEGLLVLAMLALLLVLAPGATLLAIAFLGLAASVLLLIVQPRIKRLGGIAHYAHRETLSTLQQSLHGIRDVKLLGREQSFAHRFGRSRVQLARSNYLASTAYSLPVVIMELALLGVVLSIFAVAVVRGQATQEALPVLGLFAYAGLRLQPSLQKIISGANQMKYASAPLDDIYADLRRMSGNAASKATEVPVTFRDRLLLDGVAFRYEGSVRDAITDVHLEIRPGEVIGICGATGGGKSTLVDLIVGLLAPTDGLITVDGADLRRIVRRWQGALGVVSQVVFLTDETLSQNIALGVPPDQIDADAVADAVRLAQLEAFVSSLPDGLETVVGERGVRVSGGQRQRIAIARALYRQPSILVFDEGTAALDNKTERELIEALGHLRGTHTVIMVAHRLSTVRSADRIIFVEDGRISGVGTYDQLASTNAGFQRLAALTV